MTIYIVIKTALESTGEWCAATTEAAFRDQEAVKAWFKDKPVIWEEQINGVLCFCERAVHPQELN